MFSFYYALLLITCCCYRASAASACISQDQCSIFETCVLGQCMSPGEGEGGGTVCASDDQCPPWQTCSGGMCASNPFWPTTTTSGGSGGLPGPGAGSGTSGSSCTSDSDCQIQYVCSSGACVNNPFFPPTQSTPKCPQGWTMYNGQCFVVFRGSYTYYQASQLCRSMGGEIAILNDPLSGALVNSLNIAAGGGPYWIGLMKYGSMWIWMNGTTPVSVATYMNWRPTQPDGCCGGYIDCVLADFDNSAGMWDDAGCDTSNFAGQWFGVACEKNA